VTMSKGKIVPWEFIRRFRRGAFGWKSPPAIQRVKQAVSEITKVARRDPVLGAEGAVLFLERVSPALEQVDGSSGAIGNVVNHAVEELAAIIAGAPASAKVRAGWLERLWDAHASDEIPYIERLGDFWGDLCVSPVHGDDERGGEGGARRGGASANQDTRRERDVRRALRQPDAWAGARSLIPGKGGVCRWISVRPQTARPAASASSAL
jgi:hypothetical protein